MEQMQQSGRTRRNGRWSRLRHARLVPRLCKMLWRDQRPEPCDALLGSFRCFVSFNSFFFVRLLLTTRRIYSPPSIDDSAGLVTSTLATLIITLISKSLLRLRKGQSLPLCCVLQNPTTTTGLELERSLSRPMTLRPKPTSTSLPRLPRSSRPRLQTRRKKTSPLPK